MSRAGAIVTGAALMVLGVVLVLSGLVIPDGEHPLVTVGRLYLDWMLGIILVAAGAATVVVGVWLARRRGQRPPVDGLDRDLRESARWPSPSDW